ncbi:hypothetical protein RFI_05219 [Reticulomyxa filosa]|uniref:Uncharacterized protein n=1 Tax=Reticulomyxa filosa TaxID=46433 RepID=X6P016_RETFI|nr:hypothetical protein RFI_05219 [Reticulomyxa filosa]|eukprot:ETO31895.1 hypothetical protein RFI_05219 [Reticulomyxa filosa]
MNDNTKSRETDNVKSWILTLKKDDMLRVYDPGEKQLVRAKLLEDPKPTGEAKIETLLPQKQTNVRKLLIYQEYYKCSLPINSDVVPTIQATQIMQKSAITQEAEIKEAEIRQPEIRQSETKQSELKQLEIKQPQMKPERDNSIATVATVATVTNPILASKNENEKSANKDTESNETKATQKERNEPKKNEDEDKKKDITEEVETKINGNDDCTEQTNEKKKEKQSTKSANCKNETTTNPTQCNDQQIQLVFPTKPQNKKRNRSKMETSDIGTMSQSIDMFMSPPKRMKFASHGKSPLFSFFFALFFFISLLLQYMHHQPNLFYSMKRNKNDRLLSKGM